ncbi:MAG TPA: PDZ domain-containing protein [Ignavibacteriaceae bacterium]|nr:PDZ domain-containing protein [Ignavibacteriaceae bacterium]
MKNHFIIKILIVDLILIIFGVLNFFLLINRAGLPQKYSININSFSFDIHNIKTGEEIIEFNGKKINQDGLLEFYLLNHSINDTVTLKSEKNGKVFSNIVKLPAKYSLIELGIMAIVTLFYFSTGIYMLLKFKPTTFAYVLHMLAISTGLMIIFDWGETITYSPLINFFLFTFFELGIFFVPTLFLHFSFTYPIAESKSKFIALVPFYFASVTFFVISECNLIGIFFLKENITNSYFLSFHTHIADIFLIIGLVLTIAKFEYSALTIKDKIYMKKIYWALLGISFGPLIYVFLILIPRLILGYELVSESIMQFTIIIAPIMLLISVNIKETKLAL